MAASGKGKPKADINVVPLVDVCLVLLIIFMVVTPMLQTGANVQLPKATHADEKDERASNDVIVSVTDAGAIWLVDDPQGGTKAYQVTKEELQTAVGAIVAREPYRPILIKGDKALTYGEVKKVMLLCRQAGASAVNLAAEADKGSKSSDGDEKEMASAWRP